MTAAGGTISVLVGAVLLRLSLTGTYQRYVRVGMGPWLTLAGLVVVALGLATLVRALRASSRPTAAVTSVGAGTAPAVEPGAAGPPGVHGDAGTDDRVHQAGHGQPGQRHGGPDHDDEHDDEHGHDDAHGQRVGWLLLAPIAALLLVAPPTLGSYGVDRGAAVDVRAGAPAFAPLPAGGEPAPMTLLEFNQRALDHDGESFAGQAVQLTGFVADEATPFRLARYQIACCAVDAAPVVVRIVGTVGASPVRDQWVTVTGTFTGMDGDDVPELAATSIVEIPAPEDPYE